MVDSANIIQISSSCIQLLSVLSAEPLHKASVLVLFNKRWDSHNTHTHPKAPELAVPFGCVLPKTDSISFFRDLPCTMSLVEMKSLFRMDDIIACASQPITTLELSARSGQGLQEVLSWLDSTVGEWPCVITLILRDICATRCLNGVIVPVSEASSSSTQRKRYCKYHGLVSCTFYAIMVI